MSYRSLVSRKLNHPRESARSGQVYRPQKCPSGLRHGPTDIAPTVHGHGHIYRLGGGHVIITMHLLPIGVPIRVFAPGVLVRVLVPAVTRWRCPPGVTRGFLAIGPGCIGERKNKPHGHYTNKEISCSHMLSSFFFGLAWLDVSRAKRFTGSSPRGAVGAGRPPQPRCLGAKREGKNGAGRGDLKSPGTFP